MDKALSFVREHKLLSWLVLLALVVATFREWYWLWGLLFLFWSVQGLRAGHAFLIEDIARDEQPALYWVITAMWASFGLWYVYADLIWRV